MKEIALSFDGYYRDENKDALEEKAGIYCVYRCKKTGKKKVSLKELLYIGQAENIHDRLSIHNKFDDWCEHLEPGEELCYSQAFISNADDRFRAEAALIFKHKPPENTEHLNHFGYPDTKIVLSGDIRYLIPVFAIESDD